MHSWAPFMIFIIMAGSEEFSMFSATKLITIIGKQNRY